jgi:hypothetical protein
MAIPLLTHLLDKRGAQTAAWTAFKAAKAMPYLRAPAITQADLLAELLRRKKEE